ncbi:RNA-binding S4 domain [Phaffia rhodozyma]|uniref:RNA-binding S4 domain n=1 Tax=Phaffia rhodozyma TaxID=264483 RepID=A0A0F7SNM0_PHARH|nr:RNA-binding S4 domain [Phaffia rhodozyma]
MRIKTNPYDVEKSMMRMGWNPTNVYNTWKRNAGPLAGQYNFRKSKDSLYQLRFRSKQHLRAYWGGSKIEDRQFRKWYLPSALPLIVPSALTSPTLNPKATSITRFSHPGKEGGRHLLEQEEMFRYHGSQAPVSPLMFREVERRLDHVIFRGGFARSAEEARGLIGSGAVRLNGNVERQCQIRLLPGDFLEIDPSSVKMLSIPDGSSILAAVDKDVVPLRKRQELLTKRPSATPVDEDGEESEQALGEKVNNGEGWKAVYRARLTSLLGMGAAEVDALFEKGEKKTRDLWLRRWNAIKKKEADAQDAVMQSKLASLSLGSPSATTDSTPSPSADVTSAGSSSEASSESSSPTGWQRPAMKPLTPTHHVPQPSDPPGTLHFNLPPFAGPSLFVPAYLQPNYAYCTLTYLRHPTARHKYEEIPSPFDAKGDVMKSAWEWYVQRRIRIKTFGGGLFPGGIDARARLKSRNRGPEIKRSGVVEDFY